MEGMEKKWIFIIAGIAVLVSGIFIVSLVMRSSKQPEAPPTPIPSVVIPGNFPIDMPIYSKELVKKAEMVETLPSFQNPSKLQYIFWLDISKNVSVGEISSFYRNEATKKQWKLIAIEETLSGLKSSFIRGDNVLEVEMRDPDKEEKKFIKEGMINIVKFSVPIPAE